MNGAPIAAGLILAMLALALAFVPRGIALASAGLGIIAAVGGSTVFQLSAGPASAGGWISLAILALSVYWPRPAQSQPWLILVLSANAGLWAGLVMATEGSYLAVLPVLPVLLFGIPAAWCVARGWTIPVRIVASWLLAVAILVGAIPHLVVHPGYVPDHRI